MNQVTEIQAKMAETPDIPPAEDKLLNLDPSEYTLQFSAAGILDTLGGCANIREGLARYDLPEVSPHTVNMWRYRNSIPSNWLATLLILADRMGINLDLKYHIIAVVRRTLRDRMIQRIATNKPRIFQ